MAHYDKNLVNPPPLDAVDQKFYFDRGRFFLLYTQRLSAGSLLSLPLPALFLCVAQLSIPSGPSRSFSSPTRALQPGRRPFHLDFCV